MPTLELTHSQIDEILHALRTSYADYDERMPAAYNDAITAYNNIIDEIIISIKNQMEE